MKNTIAPAATKKNSDRLPSVCKWMTMREKDVLDKFCGLKHSFTDGEGLDRFVYIPGTRSDRVLLVAHADTVWGQLNIFPDIHDGVIFSKRRVGPIDIKTKNGVVTRKYGIGLGADDRVGCDIVWQLRELGHSILITSGEESGCIGSRRIMADTEYWQGEIAKHQFAIQFDRKNQKDLVFYDVGTPEFVKYVEKQTKYTTDSGTGTDIKFLCRDICGVNMSVGYYSEHMPEERLIVDQYQNTLETARAWLSQKTLPKFELKGERYDHWKTKHNAFVKWTNDHPSSSYHHRDEDDGYSDWYNSPSRTPEGGFIPVQKSKSDQTPKNKNKSWLATENGLVAIEEKKPVSTEAALKALSYKGKITCKKCNAVMMYEEWFKNDLKCPLCKQEF